MKQLYLFLWILSLTSISFAQEDTIRLDDVTISVSPFEQRLSRSTGSLSVIRTDLTDAGQTINLAEQLNTAPGVFMATGTHTTNRLTIRGVGSRTPYSSNRIKAYLEEIPLTNGDGISTVEDQDMLGLSRMEILKGPSSAMYGSGLGGVIRLSSAYPEEPGFSTQITGGYGSFNTWKLSAGVGYKKGNTAITGGLARASSDGFRENNRYERNQLFLHGRVAGLKHTFSWHLVGTDLFARIPSSLNEQDFRDNPEKAAGNWLSIQGYETYQKITGGGTWTWQLKDRWQHKMVLFGAWQDPFELRPFNTLDDRSAMGGLRDLFQYERRNMELQAGFELFHESYDWMILETLSGAPGDVLIHNSETRRYGNLFGHLHWSPLPDLNVEAGINFNILNYRIETIYHPENEDQSGSYSYQPVISPRIGVNYQWLNDQYLHGSAGHGFSAPSLEETLVPEGLVNPDLKPEEGWNIDLGFRGWAAGDRWYYDLTAYTIYIRNMLVTKRITEEIFTGINAGSARLSGLEVFNRFRLGPGTGTGGWTNHIEASVFLNSNRFTEFVDDGNDYSGNVLPGIPNSMIHAKFTSGYKDMIQLMAAVRHSGRQFMNDANTDQYGGHTLIDGRLTVRAAKRGFFQGVRISAGVRNILDTHHASMILVNAPSFGGAPPRYYYPGQPRNIFLSLVAKI